ncbi:hypothetical protein FOC1_g10003560 [Fusarium oxysporum f. sp. cubense race 1]|uniref:Uncharacterized protein n=1 Tax=Fusarium oxysporum f. sp. cubense (strain race 1) TaxID=1229664 RepID=N4UG45_FUSC1|nr:hypothetical protein FOC1_g10003560 [Fusarium oxysporum f. sp. cubense race 1]
MSTVNIVKYHFHARNVPVSEEHTRRLIARAYQTAREKELYPKAVFVRYVYFFHERSNFHLDDSNNRRQKDPL